jgi:hypothetical protein
MIATMLSALGLTPTLPRAQAPAPPPVSPIRDALNASRRASRIADRTVLLFLDPDEEPPRNARGGYDTPVQ